ncbi:MAG: ATP-binding protein [Burkholderiaceae bacterium]|nr:ATP-binding protein [Burkholderiaceae bacterium]
MRTDAVDGGVVFAVIPLRNQDDIVRARRAARDLAARLGFGNADQTRLATAVSELARNVIEYAGSGECRIRDESTPSALRVAVSVEDHGPGIANIELAMRDGYSTGGGLGAGLPGTRRLCDSFAIVSAPGHTRIDISLSLARR